MFGPFAFRLVGLVVIVIALARRKVRMAMFLVISLELSGLITEAAKAAANRSRPEGALVSALSTSFPSGHALGVMVGVLAFLTLVLPVVRRPLRGWLIVIGAIIVLTIGVGAGSAQRASPVRRVRRMGAGLRLVRRVPAGAAARAADHGSGRNTGSARYRTLKLASSTFGADLAVMGEHGGPSTAVKLNSGTRIS